VPPIPRHDAQDVVENPVTILERFVVFYLPASTKLEQMRLAPKVRRLAAGDKFVVGASSPRMPDRRLLQISQRAHRQICAHWQVQVARTGSGLRTGAKPIQSSSGTIIALGLEQLPTVSRLHVVRQSRETTASPR
jgi:hypothetical protein